MSGCQGLRDRENPAPSLSIFFSLKGVGWGGVGVRDVPDFYPVPVIPVLPELLDLPDNR